MEEQTLVVGARTTLRVRDNKKATIKGPRGKTVLACDDPNARYDLHMRIVRRTNCKKMKHLCVMFGNPTARHETQTRHVRRSNL